MKVYYGSCHCKRVKFTVNTVVQEGHSLGSGFRQNDGIRSKLREI